MKSLNSKEASLVHMVLVQILEHDSHDEATLNMILKSLEFFTDLTDVDYESLL